MDQPIDETRIRVDLFKEVQFSLCEDVIQLEQVKKALLFGGAKFLNYLSDSVTHLIADNSEHPSVSEALEIYEKPVVTSRWVWLSVKASTLLPTAGFSPFKNQLFSNIIACPSNISGADVQSLWAMITYYGGSFQLQLESNCTHLISTKPEGLKYEKAIETNEKIKIVTPDWVIDSVKNKSLCDEDLYHPRLLIFNNPSSTSNKVELSSDMTTTVANVSSGTVVTSSLPPTSGSLVGPQFTLRTVTLPTTAMITTFTIAQPPQQTQTCSPTSVQGGRVRVFLPPQHQVRLMQMKQNQNRQICPTGVPQQQQVVNVQQMFQQRQQLPQQQTQQQQQENAETNQQWTTSQPLVSQSQTYSQNAVTSQSIQVLSQSAPDFSKLRPASGAIVPQQQMPAQQQPRQVYLAVQQQGIRQQPLVQVRQQHFISVQQQSQLQQQRPQSNIIIQQRGPNHTNVQSVRLQQAPQHLIQLQQRQPITLQSGQQTFVRAPQQIIIQQQNQQAIQRQLQIQHQMQNSQSFGNQSPQTGTIGLPQVQQRMTVPRMPQQFAQQNQLRGQQIRSPITAAAQQIISTTIPTGQPRVFMKAQSQYSITQQQQFEQQQQSPQTAQFIRAQTPSQPQLQFIRNPQWQPQSQDTSAPSQQQQQLTSIRPQHILVATQPQPTQQQIMQWQQQQQDIQRRQLMQQQQQQQQQQQNPQRFQLTSAIQPEKVRPTVSVVSVSSANAETQSAQLASAATTASTVRIAQTPIPPNIALSGNHSVAQQSVNPNPVSTANTTPNATIACPIVNPKTKTALANLLNNRLQSGNTGANKGDGGNSSSDGSPSNVSGSLSLSSSTSTLPNKTGFIGSPGVALTTGEMVQHLRQEDSHQNQNQMIQIRFYGFDPRLQIPSDQCLLGCVFFIYGYENLIDSSLIKLWKLKLNKCGAEIEDNYSPKCTHVLCENFQSPLIQQAIRDGKRCVSAYWLNDVLQLKKMLPPWKLFHLPIALNDNKPCKNHIITITNFEAEDRHRIKEMILRTGAKYTGYMTQKNTIIICKRLEGEKYKKAVQWRLAIVNLFWLHDVLFGQNDALQLSTISKKYQQFDSKDPFKIDYSTVPHLMNPWRTPLPFSEEYIKSRIAEKNDKQLKSNSKDDIENKKETLESEENANEPQTKKIKLQEKSSVIVKEELSSPSLALNVIPNLQTSNPDLARNIKVMFTAINSNRDNLKSIVQNLGGRVTNSCSECTHLITDRIARTVKFMCAFSSCKFILTSDWVLESAKQNRFANELQFILNDTEREKYFNFNLQNSLQKRNPELFKGIVFYISHGCIPSPSLLKEMIESVGGIAVTTKRPTKRQLAKMRENGLKFIVITCENDLHMCDVFFSRNVDVVNVEFVLSGILRQEVNIELYAFKQNLLKDE